MGPRTDDREVLTQLVENGMDIARFNFSHGTHEEQKERMDLLKSVRQEAGKPIAILLDTKGPEIRTGLLQGGNKVTLEAGQTFTLTTDEIVGDNQRVSITYDGLAEDVEVGKRILIDDGLIELEVKAITKTDITCTVLNGGELGQRKGVNVPNVPVRLPALTEKDKEDIVFGITQDIDFIAASFVRSAECILEIKEILKEHNASHIQIIAKIENAEGIKNIDDIIRCADGIMVARGDLGVEIPAEEVPYLQKVLIQKCNDNYKPVITATQMLDSMMRNPRPTRAEVTDVANAVYDGTDAVMLSGETAAGNYPVQALKMMVQIIKNTEQHLNHEEIVRKAEEHHKKSITASIAYSSVTTAHNLGAKCILTPTESGSTARVVSKFGAESMILAATPHESTLRRMQIYKGVYPMKAVPYNTTEETCDEAIRLAKEKGFVQVGDIVVMTAGIKARSTSNMMRIALVE